LGDKIGRLKVNVEQSEVVSQSKEVGENLLAHGLTALEAIGSVIGMQAAQSLAETVRFCSIYYEIYTNYTQNSAAKHPPILTVVEFYQLVDCGKRKPLRPWLIILKIIVARRICKHWKC
jgi:hypothetical protein